MEVNQEVSVQFDGLSEAGNIYKKATDILSKWGYVTIGELQDMYPRVHMDYDKTAINMHFTAVSYNPLNDAMLTFSAKEELDIPALIRESFDNISKPSHYAEGRKYEPKDVIRDWGLNYNLGCAVKYISRAGRKDDIIQDLKKAQTYLGFEIEALEKERNHGAEIR